MKDLISIIIPVYNVEKYIEKCLKSIVNQTYSNIEIIIINDGSTDKSGEICEIFAKEDKRFVIINQQNKGVSATRNIGIQRATGKYITFVDSDDWVENDYIEKLYNNIIQDDLDVVRCQYYINTDNDQIDMEEDTNSKKIYNKHEIKNDLIPQLIQGKKMCYLYLLLIKKDVLKNINGFYEELVVMEDTCFYIDLFSNINNIKLINDKLYHHYQNSNSIIQSPLNIERNMKSILKVNNYLRKILQKNELVNYYELIDNNHFIIIVNHIFKFYKSNFPKEKIEKCLKEINSTEQFKNLCKRINKKQLRIQYKIALSLLLKNNYKLLLVLWKLIFLIKT